MRFIDLCAGIGGIRLGLDHPGWECVFSSEIDRYAQKTYAVNFGIVPEGDITRIDVASIPSFDCLAAGFPCQSFSVAGLKKGFDDIRGTLFFNIASIIEHHKPSVLFLENVPNLVIHDGGNTFRVILKTLNDLGYKVHHQTLNAKDFGLPQTRARIYIVGFKVDDVHAVDFENDFRFPVGPKTSTRVGDILEADVDRYTLTDGLWLYLQEFRKRNEAAGRGFGYIMMSEDSTHTRAISARYYKDGSEILIRQEGKNPRTLSPREAARLQGFPDTFIIPVSDDQAYRQFGNSVAVPVIKAIAEKIREHI